MTVYCQDCDHHLIPYKAAEPHQWLCTQHKNVGGFGFVTKEKWDTEKPYLRCSSMNPRGSCPLWTERRKKENE